MAVFMILTLITFIGGVFTLCKAGEKDGICKYGYTDGEDNVQD